LIGLFSCIRNVLTGILVQSTTKVKIEFVSFYRIGTMQSEDYPYRRFDTVWPFTVVAKLPLLVSTATEAGNAHWPVGNS
jgi:hypothetical protein